MFGWLGNAIDSVVYQVSPERGNRRAAARFRREYAETLRERIRKRSLSADGGFASAEQSRDAASFLKSNLSPDSMLEESRKEQNERADSAVKNYELGTSHVEGRAVRVVGCGFAVDPDIAPHNGITAEQAERWNRDLRENWDRQAERIGKKNRSMMEVAALCQRYFERRGEFFVLFGDQFDPLSPTTLKVQVIDPDRVSTPPKLEGKKNVRMGIEFDDDDNIVAYHVRTNQVNDTLDVEEKWERHTAFFPNGTPRVVHHFVEWWEGQHRGFPLMQVGLKRLKNSEEYADAEVERNYVAACHGAFVRTDLGLEDAAEAHGTVEDSDGKRVREISPGMIQYLGLSDSVEFSNPNGAPASFDKFMEYEGRMFATGANTSYELLAGDWRGVNYSGGRIIWNIEEATTKVLQEGIKKVVRWAYRHFVSRSIVGLDSFIEVSQAEYRARPWLYWAARIIPPAKASIDPSREDRNDLVNAEARLFPFSDLVEKKNGQPADKVYERIERDLKLREKFGLEVHAPQMGREEPGEEGAENPNTNPTQIGDTNPAAAEANS